MIIETIDRLIDFTKSYSAEKGKSRHLTTASARAGTHGGGGHH